MRTRWELTRRKYGGREEGNTTETTKSKMTTYV